MARSKKHKGCTFASTFEQRLANYFDEQGIAWEYEPIKIPWQPAVRYYKPDFKVTLPSGEQFYVEAKGFFDGDARSKMIQVKAQHPDVDIRMVFMRGDNVLSRKAKNPTTYTAWAERYGFPCFEIELPKEQKKPSAKRTTRRKTTQEAANASEGLPKGRSRAKTSSSKVPGSPEPGAQPVRNRRRTRRAAQGSVS